MTAQSSNKSQKPAILMISSSFSAGQTYGSVGMELAARLRAAGYSVLTTSSRRGRIARVADMEFAVLRHRRHYDLAHIDVFSGAAFSWAEWAAALLRRIGKPYILTLHGGNLPNFASRYPARVSRLLNSAAKVTAPSLYLLDKLFRYYADIQFLPNPLDIPDLHPLGSLQPRLVWLRAMHHIYNPRMAVQVAAILAPEFPDLKLDIIGPDKGDGTFQAVEKQVAETGLQQVNLIGAIPKASVMERLREYSVFLNTTTIDNTPVSILEAMASGLCIVSTNVGGLPYLLKDGETALLVDSGDAQSMANAVRRILRTPELAKQLSENARQQVERFDWSIVLPQWERLYAEVAHSRISL